MLLSDILAQLLQGGAGIAPPPGVAMLPKSQNNATGASIPRAATPPLSSPAEFTNAMTQASMAPADIALKQAQAKLAQAQIPLAQQRMTLAAQLFGALGGGGMGGDQVAMPGMSAGQPAPALGGMNPATGAPSQGVSPGNWETTHNNFAGMRIPGVVAGPNSGGFQAFATPEDGIAAISHQLDRYASGATTGKPLTTLNDIVSTWAPPSENPTASLISRASKVMGVAPDQPLNLGDPGTKAKLVEAMIRNEQGGKLPVDPATIARVVSNPSAAALTVGGALAPAQPMMPGLPGAPNQLAAPAAGSVPMLGKIPLTPENTIRLGALGDFIGMNGLGTLLQNTPAYQGALTGAKAGAENASKLQYAGPIAGAEAAGKLPYTPLNVRQGGAVGFATPGGGFNLAFQNPKLPEGYTLQPGANGRDMAAPVPGATEGITATAGAQASGTAAGKASVESNPFALNYGTNGQKGPGISDPLPLPATPSHPFQTTLPPLADAAPIAGSAKELDAKGKEWGEFENKWNDARPENEIAIQRMSAIMNAMKEQETGALTTDLSHLNAVMKALPIPGQTFSSLPDPAKVQEILKNNFQAALSTLKSTGNSRWTQRELFASQENLSNPDLQPEANLKIASQAIGTLRWENSMMDAWPVAKRLGWRDPTDFQRAYAASNPLQSAIDATEKQIGPLKGMPGGPGSPPPAGTLPAGVPEGSTYHGYSPSTGLRYFLAPTKGPKGEPQYYPVR